MNLVASPRAPQKAMITIAEADSWLVDPQLILAEIENPGSSDLSGILPYADAQTQAWATMDTDSIVKRSDLNNFQLKICPVLRNDNYGILAERTTSYGERAIQTALSEGGRLHYSEFAGCSIRFIGNNPKNFFNEIDITVRDCGISSGQIALLTELYEDCGPEFMKLFLEIGRVVHRALRHMGYSNQDIVS